MPEVCQIKNGVELLANKISNLEEAVSEEGSFEKFDGSSAKVIRIQNAKLIEEGQKIDDGGNKIDFKRWVFDPVEIAGCEWKEHTVTVQSNGNYWSSFKLKNNTWRTKCFITFEDILHKSGHSIHTTFHTNDIKGRKPDEYALGSFGDEHLKHNFHNLDKVQRYLVVTGKSKGDHEETISQTS